LDVLATVLLLLVGLELKHFVADYLLQPTWLLVGKGDLLAPGGYLHAGIHVAGTLPILLLAQVAMPLLAMLLVAEFFIHYAIDFGKYRLGDKVDVMVTPARFWAVHGLDQLLHQLTYAGIVFFALSAAV
jgi:hypothetical protein